MTLYEYLLENYPGQYERVLRTLQRRVESWKAIYGDAKEVMFEIRHEPGEMGLSDFTELKGVEITIKGQPFEHLLYHYRLAYSGWQYVQIIQGGESFIGLSQGLQNALSACGGVPKLHRSDSLSAAYRNMAGKRHKPLTRFYDAEIEEWVINLDGGPATRNDRTQFIKRMVELAQKITLPIRLIYYPPYHSKYNAIERCWAALEHYWNGAILDSVEAAVH
jgi:hypothetical protein